MQKKKKKVVHLWKSCNEKSVLFCITENLEDNIFIRSGHTIFNGWLFKLIQAQVTLWLHEPNYFFFLYIIWVLFNFVMYFS